jgi:hypothetical protein
MMISIFWPKISIPEPEISSKISVWKIGMVHESIREMSVDLGQMSHLISIPCSEWVAVPITSSIWW